MDFRIRSRPQIADHYRPTAMNGMKRTAAFFTHVKLPEKTLSYPRSQPGVWLRNVINLRYLNIRPGLYYWKSVLQETSLSKLYLRLLGHISNFTHSASVYMSIDSQIIMMEAYITMLINIPFIVNKIWRVLYRLSVFFVRQFVTSLVYVNMIRWKCQVVMS